MNLNRRTTLLSSTVVALAVVTGCATPSGSASIADTAARTPELSTLNKLINEAGLSDTLKGAGPYTVFAPSDAAFKAVPAKTLAELSADKALLKSVLTYHVLPGKVTAAQAKSGKLKSLQGSDVAVARAGDYVTVEDALVTRADLGASNGVVHIIDKVMLPPKKR